MKKKNFKGIFSGEKTLPKFYMGSLAMSDAWGAWGPGQHQKNFFSFFVRNGLKMVFTKFERIWTTFSKIWTWPSGPVIAPEPRSEGVWLGSTDEKNWFVQNFFLIILVPKWADLEHLCWSTPRRDAWMGHLAMCDGVVGSETEGGQNFLQVETHTTRKRRKNCIYC